MIFLEQLSPIFQGIVVLFGVSLIVQLLYYLAVYIRPIWRRKRLKELPTPPVSVIICARNEGEDLAQNLVTVLAQDYPEYEVVVVNDCSDDDTEALLTELKARYPHLRSTIIKNDVSFANSKKFATTIGIKAARYEWLLFTDARCRPAGTQWIRSMSHYFSDKKAVVLGFCGYPKGKGLLNKWIAYDTCFGAVRYLGFAMAGVPYMGVNANLAYRKSLFYEHKGFANHAYIPSSNDELFVNKAATKANVAVCFDHAAHVYPALVNSFRQWQWSKSDHLATSRYYKLKHTLMLWIEPLTRILLWATAAILIANLVLWKYVLGAFVLRLLIATVVMGLAAKRLNIRGIVPYIIVFDLAMPFVYAYVSLSKRLSLRRNRWR